MTLATTSLNILLALVFLYSGGRKAVGRPAVAGEAAHLGMALTRYRTIGVAEIAASAGLLLGLAWTPLGLAAAAGLVLLLLGAVIAHLRAGDRLSAWAGAAVLALLSAAAVAVQAVPL
ncbi:DoxX family protein [Pengzhenrongella sicca]|uniref:DoxX family protein n=1 Tax=Pengzhenrongella sicca TaxID=2819238 RepID=A0A8A4ZC20_9MICO|nr:DoxX family protein [Pengzhenrongella sicca]QTE28945.1 DoxX family protein [Pengzhenrongella sicca]